MKNFEYVAPRAVEEAVEALSTSHGVARPIAGGTDLVVQLQEGRKTVDRLVDLGRIPELRRVDIGEGLRLGAAAPCVDVYSNISVRRAYPILVDAVSIIGSTQIQSRASVGGNLCNAAPSGDSIPALICLDAQAVIAGPKGRRTVPVDGFCTGPGRTILEPGEILVELVIGPPEAGEGGRYLRFIPRNEMDIAVAGAGSLVRIDPETGAIAHARIALASVAPTPLRVVDAERALVGRPPSPETIAAAARIAAAQARPISDVRGSADYRRHLVEVLVKRSLVEALRRAGAPVDDALGGVAYGG